MAIHVAILQRPYLRMILDGRKTVESRLTKTAQPPFGVIRTGERIFFKESGGPFMATALAGGIEFHKDLTRPKMRQLYRRFNGVVRGEDAFWQAKADSRYATFIDLEGVEALDVGPRYAKSAYKAWFVLDEALCPLREVTLTAGAIRNCYATLPFIKPGDPAAHNTSCRPRNPDRERASYRPAKERRGPRALTDDAFDLLLPDGRVIHTDLARGRMIRWRGWGPIYRDNAVRPGDVMRFVAVEPLRYRVTFYPSRQPQGATDK